MSLTVAKVLELNVLKDAVLLAGAAGLHREVRCVGVAETPDACCWVRKDEFVITACYSIRDDLAAQLTLVRALAREGSAGLAVKFGRFIGSIPEEMIQLAEALAVPLISLPNELPFIDVSHPIMLSLLNEQADRLAFSDRVYQSLTKIALESSRLDALADGLREILGHEVSIHAESSLLDKLPVLPKKQVFGVKVKNALHGYIVVETGQPLNDLEKIAVAHAQTLAALQFINRELDQESRHNHKRDFLEELLYGKLSHPELIEARANKIGFSIYGGKYLFVVDIDNFSDYLMKKKASESRVDEIKRLLYRIVYDSLAAITHQALVVQQSDRVIAVLPTRIGGQTKETRRTRLEKVCASIHTKALELLKEMTVTITVSKEVGDIAKLGETYGQLKQIGAMVKRFKGNNRDIFMEDMDFYLLLSKIDMSMPNFCQDVLGRLESGPEKQREELLETLQTYLECQGNIMETSTKLFIHRNTLHYRLKKIAQLLDCDLSCPETRVTLWLALKARLLSGLPPTDSPN